jgi:FAD synthase
VLEAAHFHRDYLDFKNFDELVGAIKSDEAAARSWFAEQQ